MKILVELTHDAHPEMRRTAVESLGKIGNRIAIAEVVRLLGDESPSVRSAAATALGRLGGPTTTDSISALLHALEDQTEDVREAAAQALGEIDPAPDMLTEMAELFTALRPEVRRAAVLALNRIDSTRWAAVLSKAASDPDEVVRQRAVAVLGEIESPDRVRLLRERLVEDPNPAVRAEAAYRLRTLPDKELHAVLDRASATDPSVIVRRWARAVE
ncbi:MAG TPA: HEAT repeat domain-containing protein [Nitrospira sp.]|nr:HEAT repeat domain-containing protein [Nitrospira sp.]